MLHLLYQVPRSARTLRQILELKPTTKNSATRVKLNARPSQYSDHSNDRMIIHEIENLLQECDHCGSTTTKIPNCNRQCQSLYKVYGYQRCADPYSYGYPFLFEVKGYYWQAIQKGLSHPEFIDPLGQKSPLIVKATHNQPISCYLQG